MLTVTKGLRVAVYQRVSTLHQDPTMQDGLLWYAYYPRINLDMEMAGMTFGYPGQKLGGLAAFAIRAELTQIGLQIVAGTYP